MGILGCKIGMSRDFLSQASQSSKECFSAILAFLSEQGMAKPSAAKYKRDSQRILERFS